MLLGTQKLQYGNSGNFMPDIFLKFFQSGQILHVHFFFQHASQQGSKSNDRGGHNCGLKTHSVKTLSNASVEFFALCTPLPYLA
jgi:hypothetical protein